MCSALGYLRTGTLSGCFSLILEASAALTSEGGEGERKGILLLKLHNYSESIVNYTIKR